MTKKLEITCILDNQEQPTGNLVLPKDMVEGEVYEAKDELGQVVGKCQLKPAPKPKPGESVSLTP